MEHELKKQIDGQIYLGDTVELRMIVGSFRKVLTTEGFDDSDIRDYLVELVRGCF